MKRYNMPRVCTVSDEMEESEDGEWVGWDDVKILVGKLRGLEKRINRFEDGCNCAKQHTDITLRQAKGEYPRTWWICPAHGYKKI